MSYHDSNNSTESLLNQASPTFQRSPIQERRSRSSRRNPISFFSLAGLRNGIRDTFFQRTVTPVVGRKGYGTVQASDAEEAEDLERQSSGSEITLGGEDEQKEGWRVDARVISDATV